MTTAVAGWARQEIHEEPATWRIWLSVLLSLGGLGVSSYLTATHFVGTSALVCSSTGVVDCAKVTTSAQSYFLGIPVALLGLVYYVLVTLVNLPPVWRATSPWPHLARLVLAVGGMCFALYLVAAELLIIGSICIWCTTVHAITFCLFVLVVGTVPAMLGWGNVRRSA